jgi:hypothetical protein
MFRSHRERLVSAISHVFGNWLEGRSLTVRGRLTTTRSGVAGSGLGLVRWQEDETARDVTDTKVADLAPCEGLSPATMKTYRQILGPVLNNRRRGRS